MIRQFVNLLDMRGDKFSQARRPGQQKNNCPPLWGNTLICKALKFSRKSNICKLYPYYAEVVLGVVEIVVFSWRDLRASLFI